MASSQTLKNSSVDLGSLIGPDAILPNGSAASHSRLAGRRSPCLERWSPGTSNAVPI